MVISTNYVLIFLVPIHPLLCIIEISVKFGEQDVTVPIDISMSDFFRRVIPNFSFSTLREGESLNMTWCVENGVVRSEWRLADT